MSPLVNLQEVLVLELVDQDVEGKLARVAEGYEPAGIDAVWRTLLRVKIVEYASGSMVCWSWEPIGDYDPGEAWLPVALAQAEDWKLVIADEVS